MENFNLNSIDVLQNENTHKTSPLEVTFAVGIGKLRGSFTASLLLSTLSCLTYNQQYCQQGYETAKCKVCISAVFISYDHRSV